MLAVVVGHLLTWSFDDAQSPVALLVSTFEMPVFMFLSGLVIANIPSNRKCFRKMLQFLCPMIIVGSFLCLSLGKPLLSFVESNIKLGYWYLYVLALFYILLCSFRRWAHHMPLHSAFVDLLQAGTIWIGFVLLKFTLPVLWQEVLCIQQLYSYWPFFLAGFLTRKYHLAARLVHSKYLFEVALLGYLAVLVPFISGIYHLFFIAAACSIIVLVILFKQREDQENWSERLLAYMGQHSLDIYLYHFFFVHILYLCVFGTWVRATNNYLIECFVTILMALIVAQASIFVGFVVRKSQLLDKIVYGHYCE